MTHVLAKVRLGERKDAPPPQTHQALGGVELVLLLLGDGAAAPARRPDQAVLDEYQEGRAGGRARKTGEAGNGLDIRPAAVQQRRSHALG